MEKWWYDHHRKAQVLKANNKIMKTNTSQKNDTAKSSQNGKTKETLEHVFENTLKDMYWAEKYLVKSLPRLTKAAFNEDLKDALEKHQHETSLQVGRLEKCFEALAMKPVAKKCEAIVGLVAEAREAVSDYSSGNVRDVALIIAIQKIEHYEISAYGTLRTLANLMGKVQCGELLEESKDEEAEADEKLTELGTHINQLACETLAVV